MWNDPWNDLHQETYPNRLSKFIYTYLCLNLISLVIST